MMHGMNAPFSATQATVYIVDDDASVRDALGWLLRTRRLISEPFEHADAFWAAAQTWPEPTDPCCLLLDVRMPGTSGLALFDQLLQLPWFEVMPVIFLTGHADVSTAVDAVKRGAFDFCEKPFSDNALVDRVVQALELSNQQLAKRHKQQDLQRRTASLTEREHDVMRLIVAGLPNKLVADELQISVRTVEVHRAHVFDKMGVRSAVELVHLLKET
jgi:two-component system, LuxR family, response regulator DctR